MSALELKVACGGVGGWGASETGVREDLEPFTELIIDGCQQACRAIPAAYTYLDGVLKK